MYTKTELATLAGVNPSTVTRFLAKNPDVMTGDKIQAGHAKIKEYLHKRKTQKIVRVKRNASGNPVAVDDLYDEVVDFCRSRSSYSPTAIRRNFNIGMVRAKKLYSSVVSAGVLPNQEPPEAPPIPDPPPLPKKAPAPRRETPPQTLELEHLEEDDPGVREIPEDIRGLMDWSLRDILRKFGTKNGLETYLKASKTMEEIAEKRLKNYSLAGELVPKESVRRGVFEPLDTCFARMLRDGAKSVTSILFNMYKAGNSIEEAEEEARKQMGTFIKPVKKAIGRAFK